MLYAKIMLDYANYAHPENLPSMVRYGCRRYGQGWWPQTRRKKGVKKGTYRASSGERTRTRHLRAKTVRTEELLAAIPRVCTPPPSPGRHLVANSVAIVHLREVGRSQRRDCISTAIRLHSVGSHSVTILH